MSTEDDTVVLGPVRKLRINGVIDGGDGIDTLILKLSRLKSKTVVMIPFETSFRYQASTIEYTNFENISVCSFPWDDHGNLPECTFEQP